MCDDSWVCYTPEEVLALNFGEDSSWSETDCDYFNTDDLMSNFDMSQEDWFTAFDWKCLFPVEYTDNENNLWNCDHEESCWIYLEDTN